jgi:hypothetical protein
LDPSLEGTLQHRFATKHNNILSEIKWSIFRRDFSPGFEDILESGVHNGWYDIGDIIEKYVAGLIGHTGSFTTSRYLFRWLAIPWLQAEIDSWVRFKNRTAPRAVRGKVLPHGIPALIRAHPTHFGSLDFKVSNVPSLFQMLMQLYQQIATSADVFDEMAEIYAPPDHPVFQLVPPLFDELANKHYAAIGEPIVTSDTFWDIYHNVLECFRHSADEELNGILADSDRQETAAQDDGLPVLPDMQPFRNGEPVAGERNHYVGGLVASGSTQTTIQDEREYADFTSSDDDSDE